LLVCPAWTQRWSAPISAFLGWAFAAIALAVAAYAWRLRRDAQREAFIRQYRFPPGLFTKLAAKRPTLGPKEQQLVGRALKQFFLAYLKSGRRRVSMPSQVADDLWHEFILYTRNYQQFCDQAFGRFLHHTPAVVLGSVKTDNEGLRRVWWYCCREENIDPRKATRLPLLFAIDRKLGIGDGFVYELDCTSRPQRDGASTHCADDMSSTSYDGGTDGFGDGAGSGSGTGGDSGGDGGCSGGCGGGGD